MVSKHKPEIVINAAGRVGGILDNKSFSRLYLHKFNDRLKYNKFIAEI